MSTRSLSFCLPLPPSLNRIWRAVDNGIKLSEVARNYHIKAANALVHLPVAPITARVELRVTLFPSARMATRAWDIANREKCLCDALTKQKIWKDDSQIDKLVLTRAAFDPDHPNGLAMVSIYWDDTPAIS